MIDETRDLLTIREVAAILKINLQTVYRWISEGKIPAHRIGTRAIRIYRRDIDRMLAASRIGEGR